MRMRPPWIPLLAVLLAVPAAGANPGPPPTSTTPPAPQEPNRPATTSPGMLTGRTTARQEAEQLYVTAYAEVGRAKKDLEKGKIKSAQKIFRRVLERCERAVALDARYHEAWNLVGYSARKLGDLERAFAAYETCLAIQPNYAPAREYLGEAWLDRGEPGKAREQLAVLERLNAPEEAKELRERIEAYEAKHPAKSDSTAAPAAADTSGR